MPDRLSLHAPVLVNTMGHCAGAIAFGILLYLLLIDWRRATIGRSLLPTLAAALAFLWNVGSLIGMATAPVGDPIADVIVALSFSVLSLLPAVLLHISLHSRARAVCITGYAVSIAAIALHVGDLITGAPRFHYAAILLVTIGFALLTAICVAREVLGKPTDGGGKRLAGAMVLLLFAISFVHFESAHDIKAWSGEAALHHAGIPLALFVLLQDYRFLLLDVFLRFLVNGTFAAFAVWILVETEARFGLAAHASHDPFYAALVFTAACLALSLFAWLRIRIQKFLTRIVFLRSNPDRIAAKLRQMAITTRSEPAYLHSAAEAIAEFMAAPRFEVVAVPGGDNPAHNDTVSIPDPIGRHCGNWVQAVAQLRFARGDSYVLLLSSRRGGRRYLSEDLATLDRLTTIASEQVERIRNSEMQALVSQAEIRVLQAQINPHFLFNALNTLYGVIASENAVARRLVLNLAGLFRYALAANSSMSSLSEEIRIVRSYLEIEELRLGNKLTTEYDIDDSLLVAKVPILSIQPLVENAVKHGVAPRRGAGFVRLCIRREEDSILVSISNSGAFGEFAMDESGHGIGMTNVRRRLALCFGTASDLQIASSRDITTVSFTLPALPRLSHPSAL